MSSTPLTIPEVLLLKPEIFEDERGAFSETFNQNQFNQAVGRDVVFVQDNQSRSVKHVLRGLHYQIKQPQGKLIRVVVGEVFDVAVDLRRNSASFCQWVGEVISAKNKRQLWIPEGFAHGFLVLSETAEVLYKTTDYWASNHERSILWNDPQLAIDWPVIEGLPLLSPKDKKGIPLEHAEFFS